MIEVDENGYTTQYAIRLPNGQLHAHKPVSYTVEDGRIRFTEADDPEPVVYDTRQDAEEAVERFQGMAAHMGIAEWLGRIETRTCSPFTDTSREGVEDTLSDLENYLRDQQ